MCCFAYFSFLLEDVGLFLTPIHGCISAYLDIILKDNFRLLIKLTLLIVNLRKAFFFFFLKTESLIGLELAR